MGEIQKHSLNTAIISFVGLGLGYINKSILFPWFLFPEQIGLISLILSTSALFGQLANLGISHSIVRFFPYVVESKKRSFFLFNLKIISFGLLLFILLSFIFKKEIFAYYASNSALFNDYSFWVILIGAANLYFLFFEHFLKAILKVTLPVIIQELYLRIAVTFSLLGYAFGILNFDQFLIIHLLIHILPFVYLLIYTLRIKEITGNNTTTKLPVKLKKLMLKYSSFTYFNSVGSNIVFSIDTIMLASIVGLNATGIYSTILFISSALLIPYRSIYRISSALVPILWKKKDMEEMSKIYKQVTSLNLIFIVFLTLLVGFNIDTFFKLLPSEFSEGKSLFFVLMIGRAADAICGLNGFILVTSKKYYIDIYFTITLIIAAIIFNQLFIPEYKSMGAAFVTSIVISLYNFLRVGYLYLQFNIHPFKLSNLWVVIVGIGITVICYFALPTIQTVWLSLLVNSTVITIIFWIPIYLLKVDEQLNRFIQQKIMFWK